MPKIIENLSEKLLAETRRQVMEVGYQAVNIRTIAKNCGVGVGTVYNYFPSKDAMIAGFLLSDWKQSLSQLQTKAETATNPDTVLYAVYEQLVDFCSKNSQLFHDAAATVPAPPKRYHAVLRGQISGILRPFCLDDFAADFCAEALLTWSVETVPYESLRELLLPALSREKTM